ncbi:acyl carrier protein [Magnetofaba australis]|uniref:Putative acyl carrier protein n=1 Tax=Magnetofaba australis IT-1 TaxID=1434232 RepID=A0A1Y2K382_9PROT|nr:acyl carrier protein [Magnetofaba australis]OSM02508.1 putative acyl carrier protein [Magnetofaba australis IT-1]
MSNKLETLKSILREELGRDDIADDANEADYPEWDSMAYMSVVARVEEAFDVEATAANITAFSSIAGILALINGDA